VNLRNLVAAFATGIFCAPVATAQTVDAIDSPATVAAIEKALVEAIAHAEPSVVAVSRSAPTDPPPVEDRPDDVFKNLRAASDGASGGAVVGAGVIIDPAGLVLTQYLAVREGDKHTVTTTDRKTYATTIRAADPRSGLAILAIDTASRLQRKGNARNDNPGSFPAIRFADATKLRKGQFVIAIGNPYAIESDGEPTSSWGIITNLAGKAPAGTNLNDATGPYGDFRTTLHHLGALIQTDAKLGWNSGGGALVNLRGELVGITTTAATIAGHEQPAGYAIPLNATIRRAIETLKQGREVEYGMLGIGFGPPAIANTSNTNAALRVSQVYPGMPAARAGFLADDIITRVNDDPVTDIDGVQLAVSALPPGAVTQVTYERAGIAATANVTLAKLAVSGKTIATVRPDAFHGLRVDYASALDGNALAQEIASGAFDEEGCVLVSEVEPDSAAWRAGVRPRMFISEVAGKRVSTPKEFYAAARNAKGIGELRFTKLLHAESELEAGGDSD
jgi:serine protease Do